MQTRKGVKKSDPRIYRVARDQKDVRSKIVACGGEIAKLELLLRRAAYHDDHITARAALKQGADPNSQNILGEGAWENACRKGSIKTVRLFLKYGASLGADKFGKPPLIYAIQNSRRDVVKVLCVAGAVVNERDNNTLYTPLHLAAVRSDCLRITRDLLKAGADPRLKAANGCDVLQHAERYEKMFGGVNPKIFSILKTAMKSWERKPPAKAVRRKPKSQLQKMADQFINNDPGGY